MEKIRFFFKKYKTRFLIVLAVFGPGLITAFADNDAGGVATYSVAASKFGYQILITLIPITAVLALSQEIGARIAIVTGKGLADLIRERFGLKASVIVFSLLFFVNFGVILQDISGLKSALTLFGLDYRIFLPITLTFLFIFIVKASYKKTERLFFIVMIFYLTYFFSAKLAHPDLATVAKSIIIPHGKWNFDFLYTSIAVLGTTVTAWGQFVISSSVKDKKLASSSLKYEQVEVYFAAFLSNIFTMFMMIAVAATLFLHNIQIQGAAEASLAIKPFAGELAGVLFGFGLLAAGFLGCAIVPLSTAYAFAEFFGFEGSLDQDFKQSRLFYSFFLFQIILAAIFVMQPSFSLFKITLYADFFNGLVLPVIFYYIYKFANDKELMGQHVNTKLQNILLISMSIIISIGAIIGGLGKFFNL